MKHLLKTISYILVAMLASFLTFLYVGLNRDYSVPKLKQMENLIDQRFIGEKDLTAVEDAAADAMVEALGDRWSYYIPASEYKSHLETMANAYVGIGVTISVREDGTGIDVTQVTSGGPAEEAGVLPGDIMIGVDGVSLAGMTTSEVRNLVRGEAGTWIELQIIRKDAELTLKVERREVKNPVAEASMLDNGIGYVRINNFDSRCAQETIAAIEDMVGQGAKALVFDVRFNPGGYKSELVEVLDYLLPEGPLFRSEDYRGVTNVDNSDSKCLEIPMAVLVNGDSYSAAEFFAAALSEYEAAVVVGEQTCGKGYFQNTFPLNDGSALNISVGKYFTPKGVSLAGVGITPDVVCEVDRETAAKIYAGTMDPAEDPQIIAAVQALKIGK